MSHLWLLIKREIPKRRSRTVLTIMALVLGISILVSLQISINATKDAFSGIVNSEISYADLIIKNVSDSFIDVDLEKLKTIESIEEIYPRVSSQALSIKDDSPVYLKIVGVDFEKEYKAGAIEVSSGSIPRDNQVLLPEQISEKYGFIEGDTIEIETSAGRFDYKIAGIVKSKGVASKRNGNICIVTLESAQKMLSTDQYNAINIKLNKGTDVIAEKEVIEKVLPSGVLVELPEGKTSYYLKLLDGFFLGLNFFGFVALLAGCFLIYNTMSTFANNASKEIAILKVLGETRANIIIWMLVQTFLYTIVSVVIGVFLGVVSSKTITDLVMIGAIGNTPTESISIPWDIVIKMAVIGIGVSLISSLLPAIKASKVTIIQGLSIKKFRARFNKKLVYILTIADLLLVVIMLLINKEFQYSIYVIFAGIVLGFYLLLFLLIKPIAIFFSNIIDKIIAYNGYLLKTNLINNIPRTANTVFVIAICLSMAISILGLTVGFRKSLDDWMDSMKPGDIMGYSRIGFDDNTINQIKDLESIKQISPNYKNIYFHQKENLEIQVKSVDEYTVKSNSFIKYIKDGNETINNLFIEEDTLIISELLAEKSNKNINDYYEIVTQKGVVNAKIVGIIESFISEEYVIYLSVDKFKDYYPDSLLNVISITLNDNTDIKNEIKHLEEKTNNSSIEFTSMSDEIDIKKMNINQNLFSMFYVLVILSLIVSALCLINSMIMDINERGYQLSILKSLGIGKSQMISQVITQGIILGAFSCFIGVFIGMAMQYVIVKATKIVAGWDVVFLVEPSNIIIVTICGIAIAGLASIIPGFKSYKVQVVDILRRGET